MINAINYCVGCKDMGLHCLGSSCPNSKKYIEVCDNCDNNADFFIDKHAYCKSCAKTYLADIFDNLTVEEKADTLQIDCKPIGEF